MFVAIIYILFCWQIFAIGIGNINKDELEGIASEIKDEHWHHVPDYNALVAITNVVINETCHAMSRESTNMCLIVATSVKGSIIIEKGLGFGGISILWFQLYTNLSSVVGYNDCLAVKK